MNAIEERAASARQLAGADTTEALTEVIGRTLARYGDVDITDEGGARFALITSTGGMDQGEDEIREELLSRSRTQYDTDCQRRWLNSDDPIEGTDEFDEAAEIVCDTLCALSALGADYAGIVERSEDEFLATDVADADVSDLLLTALARQGIGGWIQVHEEVVEGVQVSCADDSYLHITGYTGGQITYPTREHNGLLIFRYWGEDRSTWREVYDSTSSDAEQDVQEAAAAVKAELRRSSPNYLPATSVEEDPAIEWDGTIVGVRREEGALIVWIDTEDSRASVDVSINGGTVFHHSET